MRVTTAELAVSHRSAGLIQHSSLWSLLTFKILNFWIHQQEYTLAIKKFEDLKKIETLHTSSVNKFETHEDKLF